MYRPLKYQKDDKEFIFSFIESNPFASMVVQGGNLVATHVPILTEGNENDWSLFSHTAKHNEISKYLKDGAEALLIFQGAHSYISSSWYKEKDISTWDYSAVHVNARVRLQTGAELEDSLKKLVGKFEKDQEDPLYYKDIPKKMLVDHLPLITGFWLEPFKVQGVAKLHQSYQKDDIKAVVSQLDKGNNMERDLSADIKAENDL
ncbi:FMN-binding negative transcriptional regulator [Christiangramia salexigens]|uniref:Negative transcriptional regulator n=1 Tax=Christiangramia salexigens TaxID=1913577 RepID=A0A1L3J5X9_9FLAO|nr:FMN-binding negative transcriptional regulator [Christiangramia salexigens]APG60522.1 negative transcriptional regulator [Christiangramia salexigens]